jgi:Uncharacterized protein conserved in bacteria (DUF2334)
MRSDAAQTARLSASDAGREPVLGALLARRLAPAIPPASVRISQLLANKLDPVRVGRRALEPGRAARRSLLGAAAAAPPRFLLRVDEFPCARAFDEPDRYGVEDSARFHAVFADAGVPYLMAVVPQLVRRPLDPAASGGRPLGPDELKLIERMAGDGVAFAVHGLTHRTRDPRPRYHSELIGLSAEGLDALLDESLRLFASFGVAPRVFVPPFNRFGLDQYPQLAARFDVVCGGPESIRYLGLQPTPRWLGDAVYFPSYQPLYGTAATALPEANRMIDTRPGTWVPITLHLNWELDSGLEPLKRLLDRLGPYTASWADFLASVKASRQST